MKFIIFAAVVAVCAAAPAPYSFIGGHPLTYSAPQTFGAFPTTYTGATADFQGQFFGGHPGTYVHKSGAGIAPIVAHQPIVYSAPHTSGFTYSAVQQPSALTYSAVQQPSALTYSAVQHPSALTYSAVQQPSALTYSAGSAIVPVAGGFPKTVQQNEGARLITY